MKLLFKSCSSFLITLEGRKSSSSETPESEDDVQKRRDKLIKTKQKDPKNRHQTRLKVHKSLFVLLAG